MSSLWHANLFWALWLALTIGTFLVRELTAVASHRMNDTLSRWLRRWLGIHPHRWWAPLGIALFDGGLAVLAIHITTPFL